MATAYLIFMVAIGALVVAVVVKSIITGKKFEPVKGAYMPDYFNQTSINPHTTYVEKVAK